MQKVPTYIVVISSLMVVSLMAVTLMYIWFPDAISGQSFAKVVVTFVVLLLGSVFIAVLTRVSQWRVQKESKDVGVTEERAE